MYLGYIPSIPSFVKNRSVEDVLIQMLFISEEFLMKSLKEECIRQLICILDISTAPSVFIATKALGIRKLLVAAACTTLLHLEIDREQGSVQAQQVQEEKDERAYTSTENLQEEIKVDEFLLDAIEYLAGIYR